MGGILVYYPSRRFAEPFTNSANLGRIGAGLLITKGNAHAVGGADYSSKEGANDPELVVTLGGTPTPTNTPTSGPSLTPTNTPIPTATFTPTPTAILPIFSNAAFTYNGDGKRVKSVITTNIATTTTYFVGVHYEVANGVVTKYYYAGSQRIALRANGTLNFLLGDHLGSTSLTTDDNGQIVSELRYQAWGETRYSSGNTPTKYQYTGQYSYASDFGLHFYNARWYDSSLGRFAQADSIIPGGVQGYDRYAYVMNNPLRYTDPTGHMMCADCGGGGGSYTPPPPNTNYCTTHPWACGGGGGGGGGGSGGGSGGGGGGSGGGLPSPLLTPNLEGGDGLPSVSLGVTCGQQGVYSSSCPGWHEYRVENVACPAIFHCTEEEMMDYMLRFAYPNQDPSQPAENRHRYTVGIPIVGFDLDEMGPIRFTTSNGGLTTTNTTLRPHILYDGKVERTASQNANGDWIVVTEGWGNNAIPGMDVANMVGGPILFNTVDVQMYMYIATDQLFGP